MNHLKRIFFSLIFSLLAVATLHAQHPLWTRGTALTVDERALDFGVFAPAIYGKTSHFELQTYHNVFLLMPNFGIKKNWKNTDVFVATRHAIHYPSLMLNLFSREGFPGVLPPATSVPQTLGLTNELLLSTYLKKPTSCTAPNNLLTFKAGAMVAPFSAGESTLTTIDYPLSHPRSSVYTENVMWYIGLDLDAHFNQYLNYCVDIDYTSVGFGTGFWEIGHKGLVIWPLRSKKHTLVMGYKLTYGSYPFGNKLTFMPLIDFLWHFQFRRKPTPGEVGML